MRKPAKLTMSWKFDKEAILDEEDLIKISDEFDKTISEMWESFGAEKHLHPDDYKTLKNKGHKGIAVVTNTDIEPTRYFISLKHDDEEK